MYIYIYIYRERERDTELPAVIRCDSAFDSARRESFARVNPRDASRSLEYIYICIYVYMYIFIYIYI